MKTRLRDLKIIEGSLCKKGANPFAEIKLFKADKPMKTENEKQYPAEAFAYVPDPEKPSTWKLRLWEDSEETAAQVGRAIAALGKGFRGNKVDIPESDLAKVKAKIKAAWKKVNPDSEEVPEVLKSEIPIIKRMKEIWKALTFNEVLDSKEANRDWWEITNAFEQSVKSILADKEISNQTSMLLDTCMQFATAAKPIVPRLAEPIYLSAEGAVTAIEAITEDIEKAGKTISSANMQRLQVAMAAIKEIMGQMMEGEPPDNSAMDNNKSSKKVIKGDDHMELKEILKALPQDQQDVINKAIENATSEAINKQVDVAAISKAVEEKFSEQLKKQAEDNEKLQKALDAEKDLRITKEFISKAAEYKNLGTKPDDFGKVLKEIAQKVIPETYTELEKVLAGADEKIGKNDIFLKEIGSGGEAVLETIDKVNKMVEEIRKTDPKITKEQAEAKVWMEHPELYREYEAEKRQ